METIVEVSEESKEELIEELPRLKPTIT